MLTIIPIADGTSVQYYFAKDSHGSHSSNYSHVDSNNNFLQFFSRETPELNELLSMRLDKLFPSNHKAIYNPHKFKLINGKRIFNWWKFEKAIDVNYE